MDRRTFMAGLLALVAPSGGVDWSRKLVYRPRGVGITEIGRGLCFSVPGCLVNLYVGTPHDGRVCYKLVSPTVPDGTWSFTQEGV